MRQSSNYRREGAGITGCMGFSGAGERAERGMMRAVRSQPGTGPGNLLCGLLEKERRGSDKEGGAGANKRRGRLSRAAVGGQA